MATRPPFRRREQLGAADLAAAASMDVAAADTEESEDGGGLLALIGPALIEAVCVPTYGTPRPAVLRCRTRGGTATLCGISEYVTPSTPPKKYRTQTAAGDQTSCAQWSANPPPPCAPPNYYRVNDNYSGAYNYNATTCAQSNNGLRTRTETTAFPNPPVGCSTAAPCPLFVGTAVLNVVWAPISSGVFLYTVTPTQQAWQYAGCGIVGIPSDNITRLGLVTSTLSNEDQESDAITRLLAGTAWSAWGTVGGGCVNPACCLSSWEARVAGFSFVYQESEFEVSLGGGVLLPDTTYCVGVDVYVSTYGSGVWVLQSTRNYFTDSDGAGNLLFSDAVPSARGASYYVANPRVFRRFGGA